MAVRKLKPTSAGRRFQTVSDFEEITRTTPEKSLTEGLTKKAGRNNHGRVTSRRRGGGVKRLYRIIDFKRNKLDIPATVAHIEYDPNRTARIALLRAALGSVADRAIIPMYDWLGLGAEAHLNTPGKLGGNWAWRAADGFAAKALAKTIHDECSVYCRV